MKIPFFLWMAVRVWRPLLQPRASAVPSLPCQAWTALLLPSNDPVGEDSFQRRPAVWLLWQKPRLGSVGRAGA